MRTIFTEQQRDWLAANAKNYTRRELARIVDTDIDGLLRLFKREGIYHNDDSLTREPMSLGDINTASAVFASMDWDRHIERPKRRAKEVVNGIDAVKAYKNAVRHNPDEVHEVLPMSGMVITWGEYAMRLKILTEQ